MTPKHNYVACQWCVNYTDNMRRESPCERCKNIKTVIDPKEILCNMCGGYMSGILGTPNEQAIYGLYNAKVSGGYDSHYLFDMTEYTFNLCEKCLRQLFMQCLIKPGIHEFVGGDQEANWETDQRAYEYQEWKKTGGHHQAYMNGKCNTIKDCQNDAIFTLMLHGEFTEECACQFHSEIYQTYGGEQLVDFISHTLKPFI